MKKQNELFQSNLVPGKPGSGQLFDEELSAGSGKSDPVTCLGMTFENDEARRAHFTEELRNKLQDPEFRKIEGFPIGSDEDILNLSDPPYYTACPNPFFELFLLENQEQDNQDNYHCNAFAVEVPEKRHDPVGLAHTYHTKISHNTIAEMVSHYTRPGDLILDCFSGSGMTAIGTIIANNNNSSPVRRCIELDLSPAASLLSYSYSKKTNPYRFKMAVEQILSEIENELGWMYKYQHSGKELFLSSLVWCEVYNCDVCGA